MWVWVLRQTQLLAMVMPSGGVPGEQHEVHVPKLARPEAVDQLVKGWRVWLLQLRHQQRLGHEQLQQALQPRPRP